MTNLTGSEVQIQSLQQPVCCLRVSRSTSQKLPHYVDSCEPKGTGEKTNLLYGLIFRNFLLIDGFTLSTGVD